MKAYIHERAGDLLKSLQLKEIEEPVTSPAYPVLLRVQAVSIQPADYKLLELAPSLIAKRPGIPLGDFAGVVLKSELPEWKEGDEIALVHKLYRTGHGTLAEVVALPRDAAIARKPSHLSCSNVAGMTVSALTAWGLLDACRDARRILLNGSSGGVGHFVLQLAKAQGRYVVATCSARTEKLVKAWGADETVDYQSCDLPTHLAEKYPKTFDAVIDTVGLDSLYRSSPAFVKPGAGYFNVGASIKGLQDALRHVVMQTANRFLPVVLGGISTSYRYVNVEVKPGAIERIMPFIEDGRLKTHVDRTYSFKDASKAIEAQKGGRVCGKVIITVNTQ